MSGTPAQDALTLLRSGESTFTAGSVPDEHRPVVFGGQLLGQLIRAAVAVEPAKTVRSVQAVFMRAGRTDQELEFVVDAPHRGRSLSTHDISVRQGDREICHGLVMSDHADPEVLTIAEPAPEVPGPDDLPAERGMGTPGADIRLIGGVDLQDTAIGPPDIQAWVRWADPGPVGQDVHQGLLCWYSDPLLIPASLRPLEGLSVAMAHDTLSTGVLQHTMIFHAPCDAAGWNLYTVRTVQAGLGRVYGEGRIHNENRELIASFSQWAMVRPMPERSAAFSGPAM